ncbi:hypothetical protein JL720_8819 [Aureococcus anophagefferens]|nr:hypothetical protein JL720_8819 [Aureococcus anophagefferens]
MGKATVSVAPASPPRPGPRKLMPRPGSRQYRNRRNRKTSIMANENNFQLSYDQQYMRQNEFPAQDNALFPVLRPFGARRQWTRAIGEAFRGRRDGACVYFWWERLVDLVFLGDILVNFNTAFLDKDNCEWVLSRPRIGAKYVLSPWFFIDVVAIVPFELFGLARNDAAATSVRLLRLLKIVRLLRLLRVLKLLRLLGKYATRLKVSYRMRAILKFVVYISASRRALRGDDRDNPTWLREEGMHGETLWAQYGAAMAWAVSALNGSASAYTGAEYCVAVVVMILGCIVLTLMIGEIANVSTSLDPAGNEYKRTMDMFNSYMDERGFHKQLKKELRSYFMHSEGLFREQHYHDMLKNLSPQLREKLALANVGPWIKSVPVVRYALIKASGLFVSAKVAVSSLDPDDDDDPYRGGVVTGLPQSIHITVTYNDGSVEFHVDAGRLHVPRYLPFGRRFNAAKRASELLITDLATRMTATLYLRDDAIVAMGSWLNNMYLLDITMKLTTERELSRNHEVTARSTSHCLCLSTVDFLDCMAKSNYKMLVSPMKRYAGWLMLREYCVYHKHVVTEHMDIFSAAHAKLFAHRMQIKVFSPRAMPCEETAKEVLGDAGLGGLHERSGQTGRVAAGARPAVPRLAIAEPIDEEPPAPERDDDDDDDDDDSAAATVDALRRTVDRAGRAARRVVVDGDAAESPRSVEELKFQLRASINGLISVYRELDPEALATPGKRRRKVGQLGKHVPPIPADWVRLFEGPEPAAAALRRGPARRP